MRQIAIETITYTILGFIAVVLTLLGQNLVRRLDALTTLGLTSADLSAVIQSLFAMMAPYAIPVAFLFGCLACLRRMSADGEILAMRASGLGSGTLLVPPVALGLGLSLLCGYLMIYVEFDARQQIVTLFKQAALRGAGIEAGDFRNLGNKIVYVDHHNREGDLEGVMIVDYSNPDLLIRVYAETGKFYFDDSTGLLHFNLKNGDMHLHGRGQSMAKTRRMAFEEFDFPYDISKLIGNTFAANRPRQMSLEELASVIKAAEEDGLDDMSQLHESDPVAFMIERQRRFSLPWVPLLFALVAVPLGQRASRGGRAWGVVLCIAVATLYYTAVAASNSVARMDLLPVEVALWIPNLLLGSFALFMIIRDETSVPR